MTLDQFLVDIHNRFPINREEQNVKESRQLLVANCEVVIQGSDSRADSVRSGGSVVSNEDANLVALRVRVSKRFVVL